jgi:hypothetical protein
MATQSSFKITGIIVSLLCLIAFAAFLEIWDGILIPFIIIGLGALVSLIFAVIESGELLKGIHQDNARRERVYKFLASIMGLFLFTGSLLFLTAFIFISREPDANSAPYFVDSEYLFRSIICSLDLFMLNIDSNIMDSLGKHELLKGLISIQAIASFSCTVAILVSLIYTRTIAYIKLQFFTNIGKKRNKLYIFFEMNDSAQTLAQSIREENPSAVIIFVENKHLEDEKTDGWNGIVGFFTHKKQVFNFATKNRCGVTFSEYRLSDIHIDELANNDILEMMNLTKVKKLIQKVAKNTGELHIFVMSEDNESNIRALSTLTVDVTISEACKALDPRHHHLYCCTRHNALSHVIEDIAVKKDYNIHIIDPSHIAIELLKMDLDNHPVKLISIDKDNPTTTSSEFCSMIIGFGEAGRDAFNFLYEFGAFIHQSSTEEDVKRSYFKCLAFDPDMDRQKSSLLFKCPQILTYKNMVGRKDNYLELYNYDWRSEEFQTKLNEYAQRLNYIVISIGDDDAGMLAAIRIFNVIREQRENLDNLRIYVRSYKPQKEYFLNRLALHYNEGHKGEHVPSHPIIRVFGQFEQIFSYKMIVDESPIEQAKVYLDCYRELNNKKEETWDNRRGRLCGKLRRIEDDVYKIIAPEKRIVKLDNLRQLRRKEQQDISNTFHALTKIYLLKQAILHADEERILLNLAILEHTRWMASHELLGYISPRSLDKEIWDKMPEYERHGSNDHKKLHNCMINWQDLDEEAKHQTYKVDYKKFDMGVVDTSIYLHREELRND